MKTKSSPSRSPLIIIQTAVLTVAILGAGVFLVQRRLAAAREEQSVSNFLDRLKVIDQAELPVLIERLRAHPGQAELVMPDLIRLARNERAPLPQRSAALKIAGAFVNDDSRIALGVSRLDRLSDESLITAALHALGQLQPPVRAADTLAEQFDPEMPPAAIDFICQRLIQLEEPGLTAAKRIIPQFSPARREWLVGLIDHVQPDNRDSWLRVLSTDSIDEVRSAAKSALEGQ